MGVACAYELARRGVRVTLLEQEGEVGLGCSSGSAGLLGARLASPLATPQALKDGLRWMMRPDAPFHIKPRLSLVPWLAHFALACRKAPFGRAIRALTPLGVDSFAMHLTYAASGIDTGIQTRGALLTWEAEASFKAGVAELLESGAKDIAILREAEVRQVEPLLAPTVIGAVAIDEMAHTDSARWTRGLAQAAVQLGVKVVCGVRVHRLISDGHRITGVDTVDGIRRTGVVVLAAGVWSAALARPLGLDLRLQAGKGYHIDLGRGDTEPAMPIYMQEAHVVATPLGRCLRLAGTLDLGGVDTSIDHRRTDAIVRAAERNLPRLRGRRVQELWAGLRPCTADGLPLIGPTRRVENLVVATGHAMTGLALAPVTGRLVADVVCGSQPSHDIAPFSPDRF